LSIADYIEREDLTGGDLADLAEELGIEAARKIFIQWRGCCLNIPNRAPKRTIERYVVSETRKGRRLRDVARELKVSERYVQRILNAVKRDDTRQMLLFPDAECEPASTPEPAQHET